MTSLRELFPANRIAAIAGFLAGVGGLVAGLAEAFAGTEIGNALLSVAGVLVAFGTIHKFLQGSQEWEKLTAPAPPDLAALTGESPGGHLTDEEAAAEAELLQEEPLS